LVSEIDDDDEIAGIERYKALVGEQLGESD
jgi:hypothetical protein